MSKKLALIALLSTFTAGATYTDFYCTGALGTGSNLNGGSDTNTAAKVTMTNGSWTSTTGVFVGGATDLSAVTTNDWAAVYTDGSTTNNFVARVVAINDGTDTITLSCVSGASTNSFSGTIPITAASGITMKIGGSWAGPSGTVQFPFDGWFSPAMTNSTQPPRINMKCNGYKFTVAPYGSSLATDDTYNYGNADYTITAPMVHTRIGPTTIEGYVVTAGDITINPALGVMHFVGHTNGAATLYRPWLWDWTGLELRNIWFSGGGRGSSGQHTNSMVTISKYGIVRNCMFSGSWEAACLHTTSGGPITYINCSAQNCNINSANGSAGFVAQTMGTYINCSVIDTVSDGLVADGAGFINTASSANPVTYINCYTKRIWGQAFSQSANSTTGVYINCLADGAMNGSFDINTATQTNSGYTILINCSAVNSSHGPRGYATGNIFTGPYLYNQGDFGITNAAYSQMNTSFVMSTNHITVNPLTDSANGNWSLNNTAGGGAAWKYSPFTFPNSGSYSATTITYPDLGPVQNIGSGNNVVLSGTVTIR